MTPRRKKFDTIGDEIDDVVERHYKIWRDAHVPHEERTSGGIHMQFWCHEEAGWMRDEIVQIIARERKQSVKDFEARLRKRANQECHATVKQFGTTAGQHGYLHGFIEALNGGMVQEIIDSMFPPQQ